MNLYQVFSQQIARQPDAIAIIDAIRERSWTFTEIENASANMAARLAAAGLRQGDGVLLLVPMSIDLYVTLLACFRLGLASVIVDPSAGREYIDRCCRLYPPRAFIATPRAHLLRLGVPALREIRYHFSTSRLVPGTAHLPLDKRARGAALCAEVPDSQAALISFTSGTSGQPKVAMRSHGFLLEQHRVINRNQRATAGSSSLTLFPAFVLSNLAAGITSILADVDLRQPQRIDVIELLRALRRHKPDSLGLQPVVMARLIEFCRRSGQQLEGSFTVYSGGAPVFPGLLERFRQIAPEARLVSVYGSTEAEPIALSEYASEQVDAANRCDKGLLAGRPVPEIELRIVRIDENRDQHVLDRDSFDAMCLSDGAIGEIVVSGNHVLPSYLNGDGDHANKYRVAGSSWHRTGDAGSIDSAGRLWLAGRCAARIEDERGTRYPLGIEASATEFAGVERAALIGHHGQRLLVIECHQAQRGLVEEQVRESRIADEIDDLRFLSRIPVDRRHNGKIDYPRLHELLN
ncbi:MAG: AMP-binding protein [Gammaproteobacteria bacterium]|nr:MAG: AMP-binding protein [Gammaproteobacteria bacterium]